MTVYVDDFNITATVPNGRRTVSGVWCHMTADTTEELVAMAQKIGLQPRYIQHPGKMHEHFDVTAPKRALAVKYGAVEVGMLESARMMRERWKARQEAERRAEQGEQA